MAEPALPVYLPGRWLDGRSAAPRAVRFRFESGAIVVEAAEAEAAPAIARAPLASIDVAEPLTHAPRLFDFPDGAVLQADESPQLAAALAAAGHRESAVVAAQRAWPASLLAALMLAAALVWAWRDGMPRAAAFLADRLPPELEAKMGDGVLSTLDRHFLRPSTLPPERRAALDRRFTAFLTAAKVDAVRRVEFRAPASGDGINAFALPGGVVVFLDGIVELADGDDEMLLAVLAHEASHQARHDMTRGLFQALGYVALAGLVWGDYSSVATNGAVLLGQLRHTRDAEARADDDAIESLRRAGISPLAIARFFDKLAEEVKESRDGNAEQADGDEGVGWLSTHPGLRERAEKARAAASAGG